MLNQIHRLPLKRIVQKVGIVRIGIRRLHNTTIVNIVNNGIKFKPEGKVTWKTVKSPKETHSQNEDIQKQLNLVLNNSEPIGPFINKVILFHKQYNTTLDVNFYSKIFQILRNRKLLKEMLLIYEDLVSMNFKLDSNFYNHILILCHYFKDNKKFDSFVLEMNNNKVNMNNYTIDIIVQKELSNNNSDKANEIINTSNHVYDWTYDKLIKYYINHQQYPLAEQTYMKLMNSSKQPNNKLNLEMGLRVYTKIENSTKQLIDIFNKIQDKDEINYSLLFLGLLEHKQYSEIEVWFDDYIKKGVKKDSLCYNIYMRSLLESNQYDKAIEIFEGMKQNNLLDVYGYTNLIKVYHQQNKIDKIIDIMEDMSHNNIQPDIILVNHYLEILMEHQYTKVAFNLYQQLNTKYNLIANNKTFYILCLGSIKNQLESKAVTFYSLLNKNMDIKYIIPLLQYAINNQWNQFVEIIIKDHQNKEYAPAMYTMLFNFYSKINNKLEFLLLFQKFKMDTQLDPDIKIYNSIMNGFNLLKQGSRSLQIYDMLLEMNYNMDDSTIAIILDSTSRHHFSERFFVIWEELEDKNYNFNSNHYTSYLEGCARMGYIDEAIDFLNHNISKLPFNTKTISTLIKFIKKYNKDQDKQIILKSFLKDKYPEHIQFINKIFID